MNPLKKTLIMIFISANFFFLLALVDDYENIKNNLISFFFKDSQKGPEPERSKLLQTIKSFNLNISKAYQTLDTKILLSIPMDKTLKSQYVQEMDFLRKQGRTMELVVKNILIKDVKVLPESRIIVKTTEIVGVKYLRIEDGQVLSSSIPKKNTLQYSLSLSSDKWLILSVEPVRINKPNNEK